MRLFRYLGVIAITALAVQHANAVYEIVVIEKPFLSSALSGVVLDPSGAPVDGVVVYDCDAEFKRVLATANSDARGRFSFRNAKRERRIT
jgi:hypothetical protein